MEKNLSTSTHTSSNNANQEFHVTYFDSHCGRIRTEVFDDLKAAERFVNRSVCDEQDWAVIDAVPVRQERLAA